MLQEYDEAESGKMLTSERQGEANVQLGGRLLEKPEFEKDLGIAVSSDLSWTTQAQKRVEKAMKAFWSIQRNISKLSTWITMKKVYRSYVVPVISYGSSLWKASKADLRKIEAVQKKVASWILQTTQLEYKECLQRLQILPLVICHEALDDYGHNTKTIQHEMGGVRLQRKFKRMNWNSGEHNLHYMKTPKTNIGN